MPILPPSATYGKVKAKGPPKEIVVPAWNDIIHLARAPSYTKRELDYMRGIGRQVDVFGRSVKYSADFFGLSVRETEQLLDMSREHRADTARKKQLAMDMLKSPSPALAKNIGVVMTALDDVQDFTTTVGVLSRLLGRVFKPAELLAIGSFTVGEFLNRLNLLNRLTGGEISKICRLVREMRNSSAHSRIKNDVDKRMKRLFPTKGEWCEILQTTDSLFGIGISLGPLVGLIQDLFFGAFTGAPIRFREWKMSDAERRAIITSFGAIDIDQAGFGFALGEDFERNESAANVVIAGEHLTWQEYGTGLVTYIETGLKARAVEVKKAVVDIWHTITFQEPETKAEARRRGFTTEEIERMYQATPPKKTKIETRLLLSGVGVDPYALDEWPIEGLGAAATIQEIQEGYEKAANKSLQFWRAKLGVSDEGLFLDACVKEIGLHASAMFCAEDGVITESLDPSLLIYINALEAHLNPPPNSSNEKFTEWSNWLLGQMEYYDIEAPDLKLLQEAHHRFFEV